MIAYKGLPHVRGGVSGQGGLIWVKKTSSPRAWGCFHTVQGVQVGYHVFPTCVGVFLLPGLCPLLQPRLPHVRGGVSPAGSSEALHCESSPRAWGCFRSIVFFQYPRRVFPTCVGVFLAAHIAPRAKQCLPHVRGGVSGFLEG